MKGLEDIFPGTHIILWQTEHIWREELSESEKKVLLLDNIPLANEKMHLAAIVVDTKSFKEVKSYHRIITAPFSAYNQFVRVNLFLDKDPEISIESPLVSLSRDFFRWARGFELYSWGEEYKIISENIDLNVIQNQSGVIKFHDIKHLFKAYGIPADNYLSSTVLQYFDHDQTPDAQTPLDNCRLLATALQKLAKTV